MTVSPEVVIMTVREFEQARDEAFQRGVERGRFEAADTTSRVARNCAHWEDSTCHHCGSQWQYFEVNAGFKCPHFVAKEGK